VIEGLLLSIGVVFLAELGDKSQLMTLAFATRYPLVPVLLGVVAASALVMGVSVLAGAVLGEALPTDLVTVLAGLAFLGVGFWTLRGGDDDDDTAVVASRSSRSAFLTVGGTFFVAELGDKTMLATVSLATRHGLWATWAGATLGMVGANLLAVAGGRALGARLSARTVRLGAAALFLLFGAVLVVDGLVS
jgi:putative Ca2+/H+ antiporter (TMEM165/GDT1 family)